MKFILKRPYVYVLIVSFIIYLSLALWLSDFFTIFKLALIYSETYNWTKLIISMILSFLIAILVAINLTYAVYNIRLRRKCKKNTAAASLGAIGGLAVGICPVCVGGLLSLILGIFGVTFSFAILPWNGIEVQLAIVLLLAGNLYFINRKSKRRKKK